MFLHQGQNNMKELRFHPIYRTLILTTAEDSFNVFRPNLDPEDMSEGGSEVQAEETKVNEAIKRTEFNVESDEDFEQEERRIMRTAKQLNRQRKERSGSRHKIKRSRKH